MANLMAAFLQGQQGGRAAREQREARENRNLMRELLTSGPLPTERDAQAEFVQRAAAIDPGLAMNWQQHFGSMNAQDLARRQAEAPLYYGALQGVKDQAGYDRARGILQSQGVDVSDMPEAYDPQQVNMAVQGYRYLGDITPGNVPFTGTSMEAQYQNILLRGDPGSPEYAAAYAAQAQPKTFFDQSSGQMVTVRPDMSPYRRPSARPTAGTVEPMAAPKSGAPAASPAKEVTPPPQPAEPRVTVESIRAPKLTMQESQNLASFEQAQKDLAAAEEVFFPDGEFSQMAAAGAQLGLPRTEGRTASQAMRRAIEVLLRLRTGAAAPQSEVDSYLNQFMPSALDNEEQARAKLDAARNFFSQTEKMFRRGRGENVPEREETTTESARTYTLPDGSTATDADIEFTAKKHGITVEQVKERMGIE